MGASSVYCRRFKSTNTTSIKLNFTYNDLIKEWEDHDEKYKDQCYTEGTTANYVRSLREHENGIVSGGKSLSERRLSDIASKEYSIVSERGQHGKRAEKNDGEEVENYSKGGNVLCKRDPV